MCEYQMSQRNAKLNRETTETRVSVSVNIDGEGQYNIDTGNGMLDHLLAQLSRHGLLDLDIAAQGDIEVGWHHLVEDTALLLGRTLKQAVGDATGITRTGHSFVPLDEALALVVVDFGGRGYPVLDMELTDHDLGNLPANLINHFLETFSREGTFNIHVKVMAGSNNHHKAEAVFKALARAMRTALSPDLKTSGRVPSTKGTIG